MEASLAQRAALGDAEAFATLYEESFGCVYAFAVRRTGKRETAEVLTERILEQVFGQLDGFTGDVPFAAWLLGIAKASVSRDGQERRTPGGTAQPGATFAHAAPR